MKILKTLFNLLRAIVTDADVIHWIKKYDAAKNRVNELEQEKEIYLNMQKLIMQRQLINEQKNIVEILRDKFGKIIRNGDFLKVNPEDDDWLDLVIEMDGKLMFISELTRKYGGNVPLRMVLQESENPAIVVGNLFENRIEFSEY
jgi:hypothetical protein